MASLRQSAANLALPVTWREWSICDDDDDDDDDDDG